MTGVLAYMVAGCVVIACSFFAATVSTVLARKRGQKIPNLPFLGIIFCLSMLAGWGAGYLVGFLLKASQLGPVARIVSIGIGSYAVTLVASVLLVQLRGALKQGTWVVTLVPWGAISLILLSSLYAPLARSLAQLETRLTCVSYLHQLHLAVKLYADDNNGQLPNTLNDLAPTYVPSPQLLVCPGAPRSDVSYAYEYDPKVSLGEHVPMIWDRQGNHRDGRNVSYADEKVEWLNEMAFQDLRR